MVHLSAQGKIEKTELNNMDNNNVTTQIEPVEKTSSQELVTDILPLLKDYFFGDFTATAADTITMTMENGQQFQLKISEVG